jgi:hypothetical protein
MRASKTSAKMYYLLEGYLAANLLLKARATMKQREEIVLVINIMAEQKIKYLMMRY